ncbi:YciI family protein [Ensifer sp. ENS07]|uniref:YciI family protein n=1 Tax=Ensifer sp. ENS07 TaxID=2769274 RepID=UPI00177E4795|nr:YciI family protein [Ensifer sp. ENS07]MBD9638822.1 YciI family protein [Ensifer sp. ENS07]
MLYSVYCLDKENSASLRDEYRTSHRAYLDLWKDKLVFSGPLLDDEDEDKQLGSLFILSVANRAEADDFIKKEDFYNAGVFAEVRIVRMRKGRYNPGLAASV